MFNDLEFRDWRYCCVGVLPCRRL